VSRLAPAEVAAAARSFPRRVREATAPEPGDTVGVDDLARSGDPSALDALDALGHALRVGADALHATMNRDEPVLVEPVRPTASRSVAAARAAIEEAALALAEQVAAVPDVDWSRTARRAGQRVDALALAETAVQDAARWLRTAAAALARARAASS
jgi:hypothetical protein